MSGKQGYERWIGRLRVIGWTVVAILLLLPAIAMPLTDEVDWSAGDFMAAGVLLIGTGLLAELVVRRTRDNAYRAVAAIALFATLLLAWSNAAVGFVGSGGNTANILYVALLAVVLAGGFVAGVRRTRHGQSHGGGGRWPRAGDGVGLRQRSGRPGGNGDHPLHEPLLRGMVVGGGSAIQENGTARGLRGLRATVLLRGPWLPKLEARGCAMLVIGTWCMGSKADHLPRMAPSSGARSRYRNVGP